MTADTTSFTRLRCDAYGCDREYPESALSRGGAACARRRAADAGWSFTWNMDLCPAHDAADVFGSHAPSTGRLTG